MRTRIGGGLAPPVDVSPGTVLGRWHVVGTLGSGGMATVYLASDDAGRRGAVKVLHRDLNELAEVKRRFLREGAIAAALRDIPGVVEIIETGETPDGTAFLVMEALEGETLFERLAREGTFPVADVLAIADRVLEILAAAHARGVIHRDLKPENLHLGADGRLIILDFGVARVVDAIQRPLGEADTEAQDAASAMPPKAATKMGAILGTAAYMAPEQATGLVDEIDARADVYSVGATMFRLLAGRPVHGAIGDATELVRAATQSAPALASVAFGVPQDVAAVVDRALAFVKHHRYPDAATMRDDVRALRAGAPPPYVRALAEGRIVPGAALPRSRMPPSMRMSSSAQVPSSGLVQAPPPSFQAPASFQAPRSAQAPASVQVPPSVGAPGSQVAPTLVDQPPLRPHTTISDDAPGPTLPDRAQRTRLIIAAVAVAALLLGVAIGVVIAFGGGG